MDEDTKDLSSEQRKILFNTDSFSLEQFLKEGEKKTPEPTWKIEASRILSLVIIFVSIVVMYGWILNVGIIGSFLPGKFLMSFIVAILFFFSGIALFFITRSRQGHRELSQVVLPATSIFILLIASTIIAASFINIQTGIETLLTENSKINSDVTVSTVQNIFTMVNFIFFAFIGILTLLNFRRISIVYLVFGALIFLSGVVASLGHILRMGVMYFDIAGVSAPMVISTAVMFMFMGLSLVLLGLRKVK